MKYGCLFKFNAAPQSYCHLHHAIDDSKLAVHRQFDECFICWEMIGVYEPTSSIPSCCDRGWFHRKCMKKAAIISPYLLHCPICGKDKESYSKFIADRGIFVPPKYPQADRKRKHKTDNDEWNAHERNAHNCSLFIIWIWCTSLNINNTSYWEISIIAKNRYW